MPQLFKCPKCKNYTLKEKCKCGEKAESPQYKFILRAESVKKE